MPFAKSDECDTIASHWMHLKHLLRMFQTHGTWSAPALTMDVYFPAMLCLAW
jgi:hypothetical protein